MDFGDTSADAALRPTVVADGMTDAPTVRRAGRPPRISRDAIAEAANELGLEGLTMRRVADHLDVSIAALYHHVEGKDDLLRLAAEVSAQKVPLPEDTDQHWAVWLFEWARYNQDAFLREPALLAQYLEGAITAESVATNLNRILGLLIRHGFTAVEALEVYELVSAFAVGTAVGDLRQRNMSGRGLASIEPSDDLPYLDQLWTEAGRHPLPTFEDRLVLVLSGIAAARGDDVAEVRRVLKRFVTAERRRQRANE